MMGQMLPSDRLATTSRCVVCRPVSEVGRRGGDVSKFKHGLLTDRMDYRIRRGEHRRRRGRRHGQSYGVRCTV